MMVMVDGGDAGRDKGGVVVVMVLLIGHLALMDG